MFVISRRLHQRNSRSFSYSVNSIINQIEKAQNSYSNISPKLLELVDKKLYLQNSHPLGILTRKIKEFFSNPAYQKSKLQSKFSLPYYIADTLSPITTVKKNFDDLLIPADHVSRKRANTYYITENLLLRTHTSCHEPELLQYGHNAFITICDVYRRDEIDSTHYPCFHQVK